MVAQLYRRLRGCNRVPSRYEVWEDGERTKNIPIEKVKGGPAFRDSASDYLLQMADLIARALLKQEEEPSPRVDGRLGVGKAFSILGRALNRRASRRDPQGVVRRQEVAQRLPPSGGYPPRRPAFRASHAALSCRGLGSGAPSRFRSPSSG